MQVIYPEIEFSQNIDVNITSDLKISERWRERDTHIWFFEWCLLWMKCLKTTAKHKKKPETDEKIKEKKIGRMFDWKTVEFFLRSSAIVQYPNTQ